MLLKFISETSILEDKELVKLGEGLMKNENHNGALWCYDQAIVSICTVTHLVFRKEHNKTIIREDFLK